MKLKCFEIEKSRFVKEQEVKDLLSNLEIKTPLSKIQVFSGRKWIYPINVFKTA